MKDSPAIKYGGIRNHVNTLQRLSQFSSNLIECGPLYAIANNRIHADTPLDPVENWQFWTKPKPNWLEAVFRAYPPESARKKYFDTMLGQSHATGIETHYDVSNDFYALFLDKKYRFYTCADFNNEQETLEDAQTNKAAYLRSLLQLTGTERILDLGCGWGAMLKYLQDQGHSGELTGFTLSKEQLAYNQQVLGFNVTLTNFITSPFEQAPYDRIFSIGALEHVRPAELKGLYQKIYDALTPGGRAVHQFFSFDLETHPISAMILPLFFPGSLLATHSKHIESAENAGFKITHDSTHDYQPTIRAWYDRLVDNKETAQAMVRLEVYHRYLTFFPLAWVFFQQQESTLHRMVMEKAD